MKSLRGVLAVALVIGAGAAPAVAEHMTLMPPRADEPGPRATTDRTVDLGFTIGRDSFRLGARLLGYGVWLNGQTRPEGFSLDGRVENPERAYNFTMNAEIDAWARRLLDGMLLP